MVKTLRTKLLIGLTPLLVIMIGLGLWAIVMFSRLGSNIDVILQENYRSVQYAEGMKDALERMDSALLFALGGEEQRARDQFAEFRPVFEANLHREQGNVTLLAQGEQQMADDLSEFYARFNEQARRYFALAAEPTGPRRRMYFNELLPTFQKIKNRADDVLRINQRNMEDMDRRARAAASLSIRMMVLALLGAAVVATAVALVLSRSILEPIRAVTQGARDMARGNLDQVVPVLTHDELGELAAAFNTMARTIREFQAAGTVRLLRARKTAQATIDSFPDPVVVVDPSGVVERANPAACRILRVVPTEGTIPWVAPPPLKPAIADVLGGRPDHLPTSLEHALCLRDQGQERFYLPRVLSIRGEDGELLGAAVVLMDVTRFRLLDQLKSDMVSTVSHELKTPLTSLQMAVHLLLEEVVGPLSPKQVELLVAARQDADRLLAMVNDLLDLTRIEQGRVKLDRHPTPAADLVREAVERFEAKSRDAGITLEMAATDLPPVLADRERVGYVFDNLIVNALAHTDRGGSIRLRAEPADGCVRFAVTDTGAGIPAEHLPQIFEKFYRVPGSRSRGGAGLGLAITREIVSAHGGQVGVESRLGLGSTFTFTLPSVPNGDETAIGPPH